MYLEIKAENMKSEDAKNIKLNFKIDKAWLEKNNLKADDIVLLRSSQTGWETLSTTELVEDSFYVYYQSEFKGLSVFAIAAKAAAVPAATTTTTPAAPSPTPTTTTTTTPPTPPIPAAPSIITVGIILIVMVLVLIFWIAKKPLIPKSAVREVTTF
jgi:hypothetical protein